MNVLNVETIERELRRYAARALHDSAERWVQTVARNHILSRLPDKDVNANFRELTLSATADQAFHYIPEDKLPEWALKALARGESVLWFDPIQVCRRELWSTLEVIVLWFNNWKADDTRLRRLDRISFPVASQAAVIWYKDVSANIWNYVTDKPVTVKTYEHGYSWVKLVSALQFEREGKLMKHCVGNGGYYDSWRKNNQREYYSLRDRHNNPHTTMEVVFEGGHPLVRKGSVHQCKGKSNGKPDRAYQPYIRRFIDDMGWTISGDASLID